MSDFLQSLSENQSITAIKFSDRYCNEQQIQLEVSTSYKDYFSCQKYQNSFPVIVRGADISRGPSNPIDSGILAKSSSPSGRRHVIFRGGGIPTPNPGTINSDKGVFCQLFENDQLKSSFSISKTVTAKTSIYNDDFFGSFNQMCWNEDESKLVIVMEKAQVSQLNDKEITDKSQDNSNSGKTCKNFELSEDWGECFGGKSNPSLYIIDFKEKTAEQILGTTYFAPAQPNWINDQEIVFIGADIEPRKYGLVYCYNRRAAVYLLNLSTKETRRISPDGLGCRSIRIYKDYIVFMANPVGGSHNRSSRLYLYYMKDQSLKILIDYQSKMSSNFAGLFCHQLPARPFSQCQMTGDVFLIFNSTFKCSKNIYSYNMRSGHLTCINEISPPHYSWIIFDLWKDKMICMKTSPIGDSDIYLSSMGNGHFKFFNPIDLGLSKKESLTSIDWLVQGSNHDAQVEMIILRPKKVNSRNPLIVYPHGGPNSSFSTEFMLYPTALAMHGFTVALINYTGSVGYGDESIERLEGKIGSLDIEDVHLSCLTLVNDPNWNIDQSNVFAIGGSHGGFISAWLSAKYPTFYKGIVLRNPVIDIATNLALSDIPDWSFSQAGIPFDMSKYRFPCDAERAEMTCKSPMSLVDAVITPTLILLGQQDRRVPNYQALNWHYALKSNGTQSQVYSFSDTGHAMDSPEAEKDMPGQISGYACLEKGQPLKKWSYIPRELGPEDIEIKISHCGICASDIHTLESGWGPSTYPLIVGHEIVGVITAKGIQVTDLAVGDRVGVGAQVWACYNRDSSGNPNNCYTCKEGVQTLCEKRVFTYNDKYQDGGVAYGGYAEAVRCSFRFAFKIPPNIPSEIAAPLLCAGITVYAPLKRNNVSSGTKCGIVGIGGLGHLAVQFANKMGAEVYAISHSASKRDLAIKTLGAHHFVDFSKEGDVKEAQGKLDVIILTANNDDLDLGAYLDLLKPRGKLIMVGIPNADLKIDCKKFIPNERSISGSVIGTPAEIREMLQIAADKNVKPIIQKLPMDKVNDGIQLVESGKVRFRVVLEN